MKQLLKIEFERAFKNKRFLIVILIEILLVSYDFLSYGVRIHNETIPFLLAHVSTGKVDNIPGAFATWIGLHYGQTRTILYSVLPILAAFVYGASLYGDEQTHYTYNIITRTKKKYYYGSKLLAVFTTGGVCAVFPFLFSLLLNAMLLPFESVLSSLKYFMADMNIFSDIFYKHPLVYVLIYLIYIFVGFGLLNCVCYLGTYIFSNGYVIMAAPFCIYFCSLVISNFFSGVATPWIYLRMNDAKKDDWLQMVIQAIILAALAGFVCFDRSRRKKDIL